MTTVFIPTALRPYTDRQSQVSVTAATVGEALAAVVHDYPDLAAQLYDDAGELRSFVNLFLGDTNVKTLDGLKTPVAADAQVLIVPAIAGGQAR
jgi:molybdopterin converting factor small subunit